VRIKENFYLLWILLIGWPVFAGGSKVEDALRRKVELQIKHGVPDSLIIKYFYGPEWAGIIEGIESCDSKWLAIQSKLKEKADGAASLDLRNALAQAIAVNPGNVFRSDLHLRDSANVTWLCESSGIDSSLDFEIFNLRERIRVLKKWSTPSFKSQREYCILGAERGLKKLIELRKIGPER
jgi:hypothetical protein